MRDFIQQLRVFESLPQGTYDDTKSLAVINTDDGSRNLYEEMKVMFELSALIYTVAYLLDLIGKGGYPDPKASSSGWFSFFSKPVLKQLHDINLVLTAQSTRASIKGDISKRVELQHNLPATTVVEFIRANAEALSRDPQITGETTSDRDISKPSRLVLAALDNIKFYQDQSYLWCMDHHFGSTDLVYAITVNRQLKRITVAFRGSTIVHDWWQNAQIKMTPLRAPKLFQETFQFDEEIMVHGGFKRYLLDEEVAKEDFTVKEVDDRRPGKYGKILRDLAECYNYEDERGVKVHEGFHLYVTGHSLGGALSSLLAMKLSCSKYLQEKVKNIPKPVINVSVASPYVGNQGFADAFKLLEEEGWLRHIRVTNEGDVVPVSPPKRFMYNTLYEPYIHTGCNVHLTEDGHEIAFDAKRTFASQFSWSTETLKERHSPADYWRRKDNDKEEFQEMSIEGLYEKYGPEKRDEITRGVEQSSDHAPKLTLGAGGRVSPAKFKTH